MKKILQNLKENWITYGFETLVVIVGILGAFALNNWSENRKSSSEAIKLLQDLKAEFEFNQEQIKGPVLLHENQVKGANTILGWIGKHQNLEDSLVERTIRETFYSWQYQPSRAVFNSIASSGKINLIQHDSLIYELNVWTNGIDNYTRMFRRQEDWFFTHVHPHFNENYPIRNIADSVKSQFKPDISVILSTVQFENAMYGMRQVSGICAQYMVWLPESQSKIIQMIDEELQRLQ